MLVVIDEVYGNLFLRLAIFTRSDVILRAMWATRMRHCMMQRGASSPTWSGRCPNFLVDFDVRRLLSKNNLKNIIIIRLKIINKDSNKRNQQHGKT